MEEIPKNKTKLLEIGAATNFMKQMKNVYGQ